MVVVLYLEPNIGEDSLVLELILLALTGKAQQAFTPATSAMGVIGGTALVTRVYTVRKSREKSADSEMSFPPCPQPSASLPQRLSMTSIY